MLLDGTAVGASLCLPRLLRTCLSCSGSETPNNAIKEWSGGHGAPVTEGGGRTWWRGRGWRSPRQEEPHVGDAHLLHPARETQIHPNPAKRFGEGLLPIPSHSAGVPTGARRTGGARSNPQTPVGESLSPKDKNDHTTTTSTRGHQKGCCGAGKVWTRPRRSVPDPEETCGNLCGTPRTQEDRAREGQKQKAAG